MSNHKDNRRPYPMSLIDDLCDAFAEVVGNHCPTPPSFDDPAVSAIRDGLGRIERALADGQTVDRAIGIITRDYYSDVQGVVDDLREQIASGDVEDRGGLDTYLHETIDGHQRVIYYAQAAQGLLATDNADAYVDDFGESPENDCQRMFAAMRRDVMEHPDCPEDEWDASIVIDASGGNAVKVHEWAREIDPKRGDVVGDVACDFLVDVDQVECDRCEGRGCDACGGTGEVDSYYNVPDEITIDDLHPIRRDAIVEELVKSGLNRALVSTDEE